MEEDSKQGRGCVSRKGVERGSCKEKDLGSYGTQQQELKRADYIRGFKGGDFVREEIKKRCEWGRHWQ